MLDTRRWKYVNPYGKSFSPASENKPFFDVRDNEWAFMCPMIGRDDDGNPDLSPRSELRELYRYKPAKWDIFRGPHKLDAVLALDEVVERVVIGQIHADEDEPAKIHVERDGAVYVTDDADNILGDKINRHLTDPAGERLFLPIGTGEVFRYVLEVPDSGYIRATITRGEKDYTTEWPINPFWKGADYCYFKAGVYCHTKDPSQYQPGEAYRARFRHVKASHF